KNLDKLLGGGVPTSAIIEINGEYRSGKTQTCLTCAVTAQLSEKLGGLDRPVIYIDTENSFHAEHIQTIGKRFNLDSKELLDNLFVVQAEQLRYLNQAIDRLPGYVQALDPGLIIIDSLMAPFRTEFHELNLLAVRQKKIGKLIGLLKRIAIAFNTTVIFTNQVMANIGFGSQYKPVIATGGHVVAHASDIRIFMKKLKGNQRRAQIDDCAWLPSAKTKFYITNSGIADAEEPEDFPNDISSKKTDEGKKAANKEKTSAVKEGLKEATKHANKKTASTKEKKEETKKMKSKSTKKVTKKEEPQEKKSTATA
ncbi:MAG: ATPase domain-containing protein, partial [Asgard group archaeon]|nr:ATPase domain-containing protein [Asgard group archaeon]